MSDMQNLNDGSLNEDLAIDFSSVALALWRARMLLLGGALLAALLLLALGLFLSPRFRADAQVFVESQNVQVTRSGNEQDQVEQTRAALDAEGVASVARLIASPDNVLEVIRELSLTENSEFNTALKPGPIDTFLTLIGLKNGPSDMAEERTVQNFLSKLNVRPIQDSRIISVQFSTKNRQLASEIPNAMVANFLKNNAVVQGIDNVETIEVLESQIDTLRSELEEAEVAIAEFRASAALEVTGGGNGTSIATQQLSDISTQLGQVRSQRASAQAKADEIKRIIDSGGSIDTLTDVQTSPLIQRLVENQTTIRAEIAQLSSSLLPTHPRIQSLQSQLDDLDQEIQRQAKNIVSSLENQVNILNNNEGELAAEFNRLRATAAEAETSSAKLNRLQGEAASLRELLATYQARYNQAISRNSGTSSSINARIAARALVPLTPYFPKPLLMAFAGFVAWLLLCGFGIIAKALLTGGAMRQVPAVSNVALKAETDAQQKVAENNSLFGGFLPPQQNSYKLDYANTSYAATIAPTLAPSAADEAQSELQENSAEPEASSELSAQEEAKDAPEKLQGTIEEEPEEALLNFYNISDLTELLSADNARRVLLISPQGEIGVGAGIQLARALSASSRPTILIDFSGSWTGVSARLGIADQLGMTDLLAQKAGFGQIIQKDTASSLHLVPAGMSSLEEVGTAYRRSHMVLDALQANYDFAIVDCGQAAPENVAEMACEGAVAVLCVNNAPSELLSDYIERLQQQGFGSVPIVELAMKNGLMQTSESVG